MGPWFVAVAVLAQTTTSSTTTTTLSGGTTPTSPSPGVPVWLVILIGALGAIAAGAATVFGLLWRRDRATAGVKIETDQQALIERLLNTIDELHDKNIELHAKMEGSGLVQMEAQARLIAVKDDTINTLQQQATQQEERIAALQKQTTSLLAMIH